MIINPRYLRACWYSFLAASSSSSRDLRTPTNPSTNPAPASLCFATYDSHRPTASAELFKVAVVGRVLVPLSARRKLVDGDVAAEAGVELEGVDWFKVAAVEEVVSERGGTRIIAAVRGGGVIISISIFFIV
jgi:hypothetical protein